jgi:hypothetical protein
MHFLVQFLSDLTFMLVQQDKEVHGLNSIILFIHVEFIILNLEILVLFGNLSHREGVYGFLDINKGIILFFEFLWS